MRAEKENDVKRPIIVVTAMVLAFACTGTAWGWEDVEESATIADAEAAAAQAVAPLAGGDTGRYTSPTNHWSWGDERLHAPMTRFGGVFGQVPQVENHGELRRGARVFPPGTPKAYRLVTPDGEERMISPDELFEMMSNAVRESKWRADHGPKTAGFRTLGPLVGKTGARSSPLSDSSWAGQQHSAPMMRYEGVSGTSNQPTPADEERD